MEKVKIQKTKNCKLLTIPNEKSSGVAILVLIKTGTRNEPENKIGLAHLVEHLLFDGTKKRPTKQHLTSEIEKTGGSFEGFTGNEYTGYGIVVLPKHLDTGVDILSDMLNNSLLSKKDIEKEKKIVAEENKLISDTPSRLIKFIIDNVLWPNTNMGRFMIDESKTLNTITKEDINDFIKKYNYANSYVVVVGNKKYLPSAKNLILKN